MKVGPGLADPVRAVREALAAAGLSAASGSIQPLIHPSVLRRLSPRVPAASGLDRLYLVRVPPQADPGQACRWIAHGGGIEYAEPLYYHRLAGIPNDPELPDQIGVMKRLQMFEAWDAGTGDRGVVIAILDGGTYWRHEDLLPNLLLNGPEDLNQSGTFDPGPPPAGDEDGVDQDGNGFADDVIGWNFSTGTGDPDGLPEAPESRTHGTATAGVACAATDNAIGMAGTSWNCSLLPVCVVAPQGENLVEFGYEGILYAASRGARIINCSWRRHGPASRFELDVIEAVTASGSLIVAAAGNDADDHDVLPSYPCAYPGVLCVGSTNTSSDLLASFSNYGASVPVYAPGIVILGPTTDGGYFKGFTGTSFSSPLAAGIAGLIAAQHPEWPPARIAGQIRMTAESIDDENPALEGRLGKGRINATRAMTESHAVVALVEARVAGLNSSPPGVFLTGDTVRIDLVFENASDVRGDGWGLTVRAEAGDPILAPLIDEIIAAFPAPGGRVEIDGLLFRVGTVTSTRAVAVRIEWSWGVGELDRTAIPMTVFPGSPVWVAQASPIPGTFTAVCAPTTATAWAAGFYPGGGPTVLRTTDAGVSWRKATGDLRDEEIYCVNAVSAERAWVGTGSGRIYRTTDGGSTWADSPYPPPLSPFINGVWFFDEATGYALGDPPQGGSTYVMMRTTDGGRTWEHVAQEPPAGAGEAGWNNSFWWTDPMHGWFGTSIDRIWRTTDGGATWQSSPTGATASIGVAFSDNSNGLAVHADGSVSRTSDGGVSWSNASVGATRLGTVAVVRSSPLAWTWSELVPYSSIDGGASWAEDVAIPLRGVVSHIAFADSTSGWAVTSAGEILRHVKGLVTDAGDSDGENDPGIPPQSSLKQNFPNPFNPFTTIRYTIAGVRGDNRAIQRVRLAVYDLLGREVAVLADGMKPPGTYEVVLEGGALASGAYLYRLIAGDFVQTRRLVHLK